MGSRKKNNYICPYIRAAYETEIPAGDLYNQHRNNDLVSNFDRGRYKRYSTTNIYNSITRIGSSL